MAAVQTSGNLLIGGDYTAQLGLQPGDDFECDQGSPGECTAEGGANPRRR